MPSERRITTYLVERTRAVFGWREYLGPFTSCFADRIADALRLYGKVGYTLEVIPLEKAGEYRRKCLKRDREDRKAMGQAEGGENP